MRITVKAVWATWALMALGGALIGGFVWTVARHDPAGTFGQNTAAWVQGLGSLAAIGAAVWIANGEARDRKHREREELMRRARAQIALINLARVLVEEAAQALDQLEYASGPIGSMMGTDAGDAKSRVAAATAALQGFPIHQLEILRVIDFLGVATSSLSQARTAGVMPAPPSGNALSRASANAHKAHGSLVEMSLRPLSEIAEDLRGGEPIKESTQDT